MFQFFNQEKTTIIKIFLYRIRIRNLDVPDTGYYRCEATNGFEKVETTGILKVLMGKNSDKSPF